MTCIAIKNSVQSTKKDQQWQLCALFFKLVKIHSMHYIFGNVSWGKCCLELIILKASFYISCWQDTCMKGNYLVGFYLFIFLSYSAGICALEVWLLFSSNCYCMVTIFICYCIISSELEMVFKQGQLISNSDSFMMFSTVSEVNYKSWVFWRNLEYDKMNTDF